jgi:hypothetical protein
MGPTFCFYQNLNSFFQLTSSNPSTYNCNTPPGLLEDDETGDDDDLVRMMEKTVEDSLTLGDYATEASWMNKRAVYAILQKDSTLMDSSIVLQQYYSDAPSTNIGKTVNADVALSQGEIENADSVTLAITPEIQPEQNYKDVNDIYIALLNGEEADSTQLEMLESIAQQCPERGGLAVYRARVMLNVIYDAVYSWDIECASSQRVANQEHATNSVTTPQDVFLFPNPNDGNMTLSYLLSGDQEGQLIIYDMMGNTVAKASLENGLHQKQINLTELASGMYYYQVTFGNTIVKNEKISIIK